MSITYCVWRNIIDYCSAPSLKIAVITLELINEVFGDVDIPDELYELVSHKEHLHLVSNMTASLPTDRPIYEDSEDMGLEDVELENLL